MYTVVIESMQYLAKDYFCVKLRREGADASLGPALSSGKSGWHAGAPLGVHVSPYLCMVVMWYVLITPKTNNANIYIYMYIYV